MDIQYVVSEKMSRHWDECHFTAYVYKNVFDDKFYSLLKRTVLQTLSRNTVTYATHRTNFNFEGENLKIVSHKQNNREQQVIYDLTFEKDWWCQTPDTAKSWGDEYIKRNVNPVFYKYLKFFENHPPYSDEPGNWIPFRMHINLLTYGKFLSAHTDMNNQYFKNDRAESRANSLTYYFEDHIEGYGGELWSDTGFVFKPKCNHAVAINGNKALHGVSANMNPNGLPRMAFTVRWAHKDDLYFPGGPDKAFYKLEE